MPGLTSGLRLGGRERAIGLTIAAVATVVALSVWAPSAAHASGCTDSWTNSKGGSWFEGANWSKKAPPTSEEEACITENGTYTVTMMQTSSTVSVKSLTVGGTSGTQSLTVASSGSLSAILTTTSGIGIGAQGAMTLTNGSDSDGNNVTVVGPITNAGILTTEKANGGARTLQGSVKNTGTLAVNTNTAYNGSSTTLTNEGALNVAEGRTLSVSAKDSVVNGAGGKIVATGSGDVLVEKEGLFTEGAGTTSGTLPVVVDDAALTYSGAGASLIALHGESTLSGNLSAGQSLSIQSTGGENADTIAAASFTNGGTITLTNASDGDGNNAALVVSSGTLANTGTLTTEKANGGARTLQGSVKNTGTLAVNTNTAYNGSSTTLTNEGALNVAEGRTLSVSAKDSVVNGAGGKIVATGSGDVLIEREASFTEGAGTTSGTLPVVVDDAALTYSGGGASLIALHGESTLSGSLSAGQSLSIQSTGGENAKTTAAAGFTNGGTITLTNASDGDGNTAALVVSAGTLDNTGTLTIEHGVGGVRTLQGNVKNTGKLAINTNTSYNGASDLLTNEGALAVAEGFVFTASNGSSVTNGTGGSIAGGSGEHPADVLQSGGTFTEGAGATSGTLPVIVDDGALAYTGGGASTIALRGTSSLSGTSSAGQSLSIQSTGGENADVTVASGFANGGAIGLTNANDGDGNSATVMVSGGTLTSTGTITAEHDNGGSRTLQGAIVNKGTIAIDTTTAFNSATGLLTNEGTLDVAAGFQLAVSGGSSVTNGTGGKIVGTGSGNVFLTGGTFTEGAGTVTGTNAVFIDDGALAYTGTGTGLIALRGTSSLSGNLASGQSLSIQSTGGENADTIAAASFTNGGTITLTNFTDGDGNGAQLTISAGTLTNGGTITTEKAVGGGRTLQGDIVNTGTIAIGTNTAYNSSETTLENKGAIDLATGVSLTVSGNDTVTNETGGTIAGAGTGALVQSSGTFNQGLGKTTGSLPVVLDNVALHYTGKGTGTIALRGSSTLSGTINAGQVLSIQSTGSENARTTSAAGFVNSGTIDLTNSKDGDGNGAVLVIGGAGTVENKGTINDEDPVGGNREIEGSVKNEKTLFLAAGETLKLTGTFVQGKKGTLKTEIDSASKLGALSVTGTASIANTLTLKQSKTFHAKAGETFAILSSAVLTGTFAKETADTVAKTVGLYYKPTYSATGVTLLATLATETLSSSSGAAGSTVIVSGAGYIPGDTIKLTFTDHAKVKTTLPNAVVNGSGEFSTEITVPPTAVEGAATINVKSTETGVSINKTFTVT